MATSRLGFCAQKFNFHAVFSTQFDASVLLLSRV